MRTPRPAARVLVVDATGRVLLMRFTPDDRAPFWCLPGGALEPGEDYAQAAARELWEEVGLVRDPGPQVARRIDEFTTLEGHPVVADERYFRVEVEQWDVAAGRPTPLETRVMTGWRWFEGGELSGWPEPIYPATLAAMLADTAP